MGFLTRVVVPLTRPSIAALAVFAFLAAWGQYLWPLVVTESTERQTVQIGSVSWQLGRPAPERGLRRSRLAVAPIFLVLALFERQIVRGLAAGALKGYRSSRRLLLPIPSDRQRRADGVLARAALPIQCLLPARRLRPESALSDIGTTPIVPTS